MNLEKTLKRLDQTRDESVSRLSELLKFKSISTNSKYKIDCISTAKWLVNELNTIGFNASLRETTGNPMVVAHTTKSKGDFLFYGHYDVQPVDPLKEWEDDPFEPKIKSISGEKVIVARGASDDKGQLMTFIEACRAINNVNNSTILGSLNKVNYDYDNEDNLIKLDFEDNLLKEIKFDLKINGQRNFGIINEYSSLFSNNPFEFDHFGFSVQNEKIK